MINIHVVDKTWGSKRECKKFKAIVLTGYRAETQGGISSYLILFYCVYSANVVQL